MPDSRINKTWHEKNLMPKKATFEDRIIWHLGHSRNCRCREMPEDIRKELNKRKLL